MSTPTRGHRLVVALATVQDCSQRYTGVNQLSENYLRLHLVAIYRALDM
jgi:hypothetical protein